MIKSTNQMKLEVCDLIETWKDSEAHQFCESLRHALIGCLPGYDDADWEVKENEPKTV